MLRLFEYNLDPPSLLDLLSNYMTCIFFGGKIQVYAVFTIFHSVHWTCDRQCPHATRKLEGRKGISQIRRERIMKHSRRTVLHATHNAAKQSLTGEHGGARLNARA